MRTISVKTVILIIMDVLNHVSVKYPIGVQILGKGFCDALRMSSLRLGSRESRCLYRKSGHLRLKRERELVRWTFGWFHT